MLHISAPATLMLMGEHAVLRNYPALALAISPRLHVYLHSRSDQEVHIESSLGSFQGQLTELSPQAPFRFVLSCIKQFASQLRQGFDLKIKSEFSATQGLGSSAAVLVATCTALYLLTQPTVQLNDTATHLAIFKHAYHSLLEVQGSGSGTDLATAILGGVVYYQMRPLIFETIGTTLPITAVYSGSKMPTKEVIKLVNTAAAKNPEAYQSYFASIGQLVANAKQALLKQDLNALAKLMQDNQNILQTMDLNNPNIDYLLSQLQQDPGILTAKISGSGLGDCVIALGQSCIKKFPKNAFENKAGMLSLPLSISKNGVLQHDSHSMY